jgi:hypothetical protein
MTLLTIQSKAQYNDTSYQSISYQKTLLKKGRFELYGWTSYDLYSLDETGFGLLITINKRKRYGKINSKFVNNWNWNFNSFRYGVDAEKNKNIQLQQRFEVSPKRYSFSKVF